MPRHKTHRKKRNHRQASAAVIQAVESEGPQGVRVGESMNPMLGNIDPASNHSFDVTRAPVAGVETTVFPGALERRLSRWGRTRLTPSSTFPSDVYAQSQQVDFKVNNCDVQVPRRAFFSWVVKNTGALDVYLKPPYAQFEKVDEKINGENISATFWDDHLYQMTYRWQDPHTIETIASMEGVVPYGTRVLMSDVSTFATSATYLYPNHTRMLVDVSLMSNTAQRCYANRIPKSGASKTLYFDVSFLNMFRGQIYWPAIKPTKPLITLWFKATDGIFEHLPHYVIAGELALLTWTDAPNFRVPGGAYAAGPPEVPASTSWTDYRSSLVTSNLQLWVEGEKYPNIMDERLRNIFGTFAWNTLKPLRDQLSDTLTTGNKTSAYQQLSSIFGDIHCFDVIIRQPNQNNSYFGPPAADTLAGYKAIKGDLTMYYGIRDFTLIKDGGTNVDIVDTPTYNNYVELVDARFAVPFLTVHKDRRRRIFADAQAQPAIPTQTVQGATDEPTIISWCNSHFPLQAMWQGANTGSMTLDGSYTFQYTLGLDHFGNTITAQSLQITILAWGGQTYLFRDGRWIVTQH